MGPAVEPSRCVLPAQEGKVRYWGLVLGRLWCVSCPWERLEVHWDGQTAFHEVLYWCCLCLLDMDLSQSKFGIFLKSREERGAALGILGWITISARFPPVFQRRERWRKDQWTRGVVTMWAFIACFIRFHVSVATYHVWPEIYGEMVPVVLVRGWAKK